MSPRISRQYRAGIRTDFINITNHQVLSCDVETNVSVSVSKLHALFRESDGASLMYIYIFMLGLTWFSVEISCVRFSTCVYTKIHYTIQLRRKWYKNPWRGGGGGRVPSPDTNTARYRLKHKQRARNQKHRRDFPLNCMPPHSHPQTGDIPPHPKVEAKRARSTVM